MNTQRITVEERAAPCGAVLVLMLLVLALFSLVAAWWVVRAGLQQADAAEYQRALTTRTAVDSALEHAKAAVADVTQLNVAAESGWIVLSSSAIEQVSYRIRLRDTAGLPANELPWPPMVARRASAVVRTQAGWQRVADPYGASHQHMQHACSLALQTHEANVGQAPALALTLADAYDDNFALAADEGTAPGFEGLVLAGARRGDEHIIPTAHIMRQSALYDVDYQRDNFAIFGAFTIDAVEPVVDDAGTTNTRVRLAARLADPARQRQWEAFQLLWKQVYPERFIPHAWRGQRAWIVMECGGAASAVTILDNDGEWLYFEGFPLAACARGRYVSINLCSARAEPGGLTAAARGVRDVWFVTGLLAHARYRLQWYADGRAVQPDHSIVLGSPVQHADETLVLAAHGAVGLAVTLMPDTRISTLHVSQPDMVAWRYTGVQPLQAHGWQWQRVVPEHIMDAVGIVSNVPAQALVMPGTLWTWNTGDRAFAMQSNTISFVPRDKAGLACIVQRTACVPSPYGGWAWRITARVHPDFPWTPGAWRGAACVRAADSNLTTRSAFLVIDNTRDTLLVHAGTRTTAEAYAPANGAMLRIGGLLDAMRRADSALVNPFGQVCARLAPVRTRPPAGMWVRYEKKRWRAGAPAALAGLHPHDTPAARVSMSPAWQSITAQIRDQQALAATLDALIRPHGIDLPVNASSAPSGWVATHIRLRRTGTRTWQLPRASTHWPNDFWRGAEVTFHHTHERARVCASRGASLELDHVVRAASGSEATLAPLAGVVFHVTANDAAQGTWEWQVPQDACGPYELYLRGFCPPGTGATARLSVAVFNPHAAAFEPLAHEAVFDQHDLIHAGVLRDEHLDTQRRFLLRIAARGAPAWLRGVYLVPAARAGRARHELAGHVSDAFCADISARVVCNGAVVAHREGTALLVRTWQGMPDNLTPVVQCERLVWNASTQ